MNAPNPRQTAPIVVLAFLVLVAVAYFLLMPRRSEPTHNPSTTKADAEKEHEITHDSPEKTKPLAKACGAAEQSGRDGQASPTEALNTEGDQPRKGEPAAQGAASVVPAGASLSSLGQEPTQTASHSSADPKQPRDDAKSVGPLQAPKAPTQSRSVAGTGPSAAGGGEAEQPVSLAPDPVSGSVAVTPGTAAAEAEKLLQQAEQAARGGDFTEAYKRALSGWQKVSPLGPKDNTCKELADRLLGHIRRYGEKANHASGGPDRDKPIHFH